MNFLLWQWRRLRLFLMLRGLSPEVRKEVLKAVELEAELEKYSRSLRRS